MDKEQLKELLQKYADKAGYRLTTDEENLNEVLQGLLDNINKFGYRYCPCRVVTGVKEKDVRIICPCVYHKEEIKTMGHCHCGLFTAKSK